ncbi:MAG: hypothetical protein GF368_02230 [Candidatus Aenigmarchaeota archaeon]|nr:hypothetical protein [Candidatus Aenigmarchaeota archaeon]
MRSLNEISTRIRTLGKESERIYEQMGASYGWRGAVLEAKYNRTLTTLRRLEAQRKYLMTQKGR